MTPEEYAEMHKKAFRVAFDFLNSHFPPEFEPEWWEKTANDAADASVLLGENDLAIELMCALMFYMEREYRKRGGYNGTHN